MTAEMHTLEEWDPLSQKDTDLSVVLAARRREIRIILQSYTGYFDLFSELIQNALDAVDRRRREGEKSYVAKIWIEIDMARPSVSVTDNGCGMGRKQFQYFVRPNYSFKDRVSSRGCKGVGATYLAYGFNYLLAATKGDDGTFISVMKLGREWVDDRDDAIPTPVFKATKEECSSPFLGLDKGSSFTVVLEGAGIRPKDLGYFGARDADQWMTVLRTVTPLGGLFLCGEDVPAVEVELVVVNKDGECSTCDDITPTYIYPHSVIGKSEKIVDFIKDLERRVSRGGDLTRVPTRFQRRNGLWGEWTSDEILEGKNHCPIRPRLSKGDKEQVQLLGIKLYIYLAFSTDIWDWFNDDKIGLRKGARLLRGGLQLATRNMPQGDPITIPMTNNIGFQNLAHVIVHFSGAEPDMGRKGFQPEHRDLAERLAVSAVTAFRKRSHLLRKPAGRRNIAQEAKLEEWIQKQREHERNSPLKITGAGLFMPSEELPITSEPIVEQDVVALFNQMLSSGLIRGVRLISSSQYEQYDGLYRILWDAPFERFFLDDTKNPLGVDPSNFISLDKDVGFEGPLKVLEYKFNVDGLIEELATEVKKASDIGLVVAWEMGEKWSQFFEVESHLDGEGDGARPYHGVTHSFRDSVSGHSVFEAMILKDLVNYLVDREGEMKRQRELYSEDFED